MFGPFAAPATLLTATQTGAQGTRPTAPIPNGARGSRVTAPRPANVPRHQPATTRTSRAGVPHIRITAIIVLLSKTVKRHAIVN